MSQTAAPPFFCAENPGGVMSPLQAAESSAEAAPFLFSEVEIGFEAAESLGEFTGERLLTRRPGIYAAVVRMLAEGLSISSISRACQVSRNTVAAVREREGVSIEQQKKELLATIRRGSQIAAERVVELLPHIQSAKDAAITLAVLVDKAALLAGEATSRIERIEAGGEDKLRDMLSSLPVLEAEVVVTTGPESCGSGQKGVALVEPVSASSPLVDAESIVSGGVQEGSAVASASLTASLTAGAGEVAEGERVAGGDLEGGEGVEILPPPPHNTTHWGEQKIFDKGVSTESAD